MGRYRAGGASLRLQAGISAALPEAARALL
jgi:hypothetical protein